jgi:hypothetical protein
MEMPDTRIQPAHAVTGTRTQPSAGPAAQPAKRRRRWPYVVGCLAVLAAIPVCLYFYLVWAGQQDLAAQIAAIERDDPRWHLHDILADRPAIPDEQNPSLLILKVDALLRPGGFDLGRKYDRAFEEPDSVHQLNFLQLEGIRTALEKHADAVKLARTLKDFSSEGRFDIKIAPDYISTLLEPLQRCRGMMWMLETDAKLRAHEEDGDGAMESCRGILVCARAIGDEPYLIAALIRIAGDAITVNTIERVLAQSEPSAKALEAMQELLAREIDVPILYKAMRGERGGYDMLIDQVENGKLKLSAIAGAVQMGGRPGSWEDWLLDFAPMVMTHGRGEHLRLMTDAVAAAKAPVEKQKQAFDQVDKETRQSKSITVRLFMPAVTKVSEANRRQQANMRSALVGMAVERYRLKNGHYPESLDAVCKAGLLTAIPTDPYSGQPLRYKVLPDGVVIYSVGFDGVDDGGNIRRDRALDRGVDQGFRLWNVDARRQPPLPPPPPDER